MHRISLLILFLLVMIPAQAQKDDASYPLVLLKDGWVQKLDDINGSLEPLFELDWPLASVSPTGEYIAYAALTNAFEQDTFNPGANARDIYVYNITTGENILVAGQIEGADPSNAIIRDLAVWSPDGLEIAYAEYIIENWDYKSTASLRVYNRDSGEIRTISDSVDMGYQDAGIAMPRILWSEVGIIHRGFNVDFANNEFSDYVMIYDPITASSIHYNVQENGKMQDQSLQQMLTIEKDGGYWLAFDMGNGVWQLYDPAADHTEFRAPAPVRYPLQGDLVLTPLPLPNSSASIRYEVWISNSFGEFGRIPTLFNSLEGFFNDISVPAISPDGALAVFIKDNDKFMLYDWNTGAETLFMPAEWPDQVLGWAPSRWVAATSDCLLAPRLRPGMSGFVDPALGANNVREGASSGSAGIGQLDPGAEFYVQFGPVCAEGYYWYEVTSGDLTGWTAEGIDDEYWVIPIYEDGSGSASPGKSG